MRRICDEDHRLCTRASGVDTYEETWEDGQLVALTEDSFGHLTRHRITLQDPGVATWESDPDGGTAFPWVTTYDPPDPAEVRRPWRSVVGTGPVTFYRGRVTETRGGELFHQRTSAPGDAWFWLSEVFIDDVEWSTRTSVVCR